VKSNAIAKINSGITELDGADALSCCALSWCSCAGATFLGADGACKLACALMQQRTHSARKMAMAHNFSIPHAIDEQPANQGK